MITTHRIIWIGKGRKPIALGLSLGNVKQAETKGGIIKKGKITLHLNPLPGQTTVPGIMKLSFHEGQSEFYTNLESSLKSKAWVIPEKEEPKKKVFSTRGAGIGGIMKNIEEKQRHAYKQ